MTLIAMDASDTGVLWFCGRIVMCTLSLPGFKREICIREDANFAPRMSLI